MGTKITQSALSKDSKHTLVDEGIHNYQIDISNVQDPTPPESGQSDKRKNTGIIIKSKDSKKDGQPSLARLFLGIGTGMYNMGLRNATFGSEANGNYWMIHDSNTKDYNTRDNKIRLTTPNEYNETAEEKREATFPSKGSHRLRIGQDSTNYNITTQILGGKTLVRNAFGKTGYCINSIRNSDDEIVYYNNPNKDTTYYLYNAICRLYIRTSKEGAIELCIGVATNSDPDHYQYSDEEVIRIRLDQLNNLGKNIVYGINQKWLTDLKDNIPQP